MVKAPCVEPNSFLIKIAHVEILIKKRLALYRILKRDLIAVGIQNQRFLDQVLALCTISLGFKTLRS